MNHIRGRFSARHTPLLLSLLLLAACSRGLVEPPEVPTPAQPTPTPGPELPPVLGPDPSDRVAAFYYPWYDTPEFGGQWVHTDRRRILKIDHEPPISGERIAPAGLYYFPDSHALVDAVEEIFVNELQENDYSINEAINILIDRGFSVQAEAATALHDTGSTKGLLELNAHLLVGGHANFTSRADTDGATIVPPVNIAPSARVSASIVGPHVSIGAGCRIDGSVLRSSIIGEKTIVTGCDLRDSFTGANAYLSGVSGIITVGDNAAVTTGALNG